jgi:hypothetical protein
VHQAQVDETAGETEQVVARGEQQEYLRLIVCFAKRPGDVAVVELPLALLGVSKPQIRVVSERGSRRP